MRLEAQTIARLLPHKYPFLLLDRVVELVPGRSAVGIKNVTINEPYFLGHFPGEPIVPGVLLVESLAQLTAVMYCAEYFPDDMDWTASRVASVDPAEIAAHVGYLVAIKNMKFMQVVRPGDCLRLQVVKRGSFENLSQIQVGASVDGRPVVDGVISVSQRG